MVGFRFFDPLMKRAVMSSRSRIRLARLNLPHGLPAATASAGFFGSYPRFYSTSTTNAAPNRLNQRYRALIEANEAFIRGRSVLDIASHDGRWSLAALKTGAHTVLGIEVRVDLVEAARANMHEYQIPEERVRFVVGDALAEVGRLEPGSFDVVFCFGFLYHTLHHMSLLSGIGRLRPRHVIIDSEIYPDPLAVIMVRRDEIAKEGLSAVPDAADPTGALVDYPSRAALELMLSNCGFMFSYYDWHRAGIESWEGLEDYYVDRRLSLVGTNVSGKAGRMPDAGDMPRANRPEAT